ncbi:hypothetical protein BGW39_002979 [Mortierella sp. 14UC]|nr:hypothetical protein BGW39_002979 [Mortierella sp. 14UC]
MGMGSLTPTPRSLPHADFHVPQNNRLGTSATAPPHAPPSSSSSSGAAAMMTGTSDQSREWSMSGASGPLPPPVSSSSAFPSFQLRKSQSVGKSNPAKKGIKSRFKKLRQKRDQQNALAFITSGESDSEAGNDNEQETTAFNTRGMTSRFATGTSDTSNNGASTTKTKTRQVAAIFDAGLPQHPFRNIAYNYNGNASGSSSITKGAATAGGDNGGPREGQQQQHKEPSAARFKDLFKNVGSGLSGHHHSHSLSISASGSPVIHPTSSPSPSWDHYYSSGGTGAGGPGGGAPMAGLMKPFQARGTFPRFGDFLSGDDQPSSAPRFRIAAPGRRKKKFSKKVSSTGYGPAATDDEDSPAPIRSVTTMFSGSGRQRYHAHQDDVSPRRQHNHQTHRFLPQLHYRHRSRSFDEGSRQDVEITWKVPPAPAGPETGSPNISPALRDARRANKDPGVLLVELEPLPTRIVHDLAAIKSHHQQQHHSSQSLQSSIQTQNSGTSAGPLNAFLTPSSTTASGFGSISSGLTTTHNNNSQNASYYNSQQMMMTPLQQLQLQEQKQHQHQYQQAHIRSKANPAAVFCSKSFLFKSYQSSKFISHYVFRVVGDQLEYKRLPEALEASCSQYFRKADFTYRSLERKAKAIREERDERKRGTSRSQSQPQLLHQQQQQQGSYPMSAKLTRTKSQELDDYNDSANSVATLSSFLKEGGGVSQGDSDRFLGGGLGGPGNSISARTSLDKRRNSGDDILKSAVAWDYYNASSSAVSTPMPAEVLSDSSISTSKGWGGKVGRSSRASRGGGGSSSYLSQRYNPKNSNNTLVRTFLAGPGSNRVLKSDPMVEMNPYAAAAGIVSFQSPMVAAVMARPPLSRTRKRSWTSIKEERRREEEEEEARFKEMERKFREELEQAVFGLELYMAEILRGLEFERFDAAADVRIVNDNRDTAIFTLYNGDRTNVMSLESPSTKLKYEFLNRISMSLMGREEAEIDGLSIAKPKETKYHFNSFLNMSTGTLRDRSEDGAEDADLLYEMIDIRLRQQGAKLRAMREGIQSAMSEVDSCLSQLDHLDERAKKMMTAMITAIDSHEVQLALRPSPSTGLTLAETIDAKLIDVNKRIVICTRNMGTARQDLNRLKYEIELEQRSIRLFRQYKIIIAVISGSIVFLVWFLYHARASALAPQPASPLFSTPPNPFEEIYNFHHGEPPILPSPASTLGFTSSNIVATQASSVPTIRPSASASSTAEKKGRDGSGMVVDFAARGFEPDSTCSEQIRNTNSKNESPVDMVRSHHLADLDLQEEPDTTTIPDHSEL